SYITINRYRKTCYIVYEFL
ncbi:hypothetical protein A5874_001994, partial [Enterococcus faecium]